MTGSMFPGGVRPDGLPAALSDRRRIAAVLTTGLLDTEPKQEFDDLADLAAAITGCERAFITLVDEDRSFWKSCVGVDLQQTGGRQNPVRESFCYFLVGLGDRFVVDDAAEDPRTRDHPSVAPMKIGAWAGYPILGPAWMWRRRISQRQAEPPWSVTSTICSMSEGRGGPPWSATCAARAWKLPRSRPWPVIPCAPTLPSTFGLPSFSSA